MRSKGVIICLAAGFAAVAVWAFLKNPHPKPIEQSQPTPDAVQTQATVSAPPPAESGNNAALNQQLREAERQKAMDRIREAQASEVTPENTAFLVTEVTHKEPEVRKAAIEALVQINDTNAIPALEQAVTMLQDPREKAALLDAIDYLKLPDFSNGVDDTWTNSLPKRTNSAPRNTPILNRKGRRAAAAAGGNAPASQGQSQPGSADGAPAPQSGNPPQ